MTRYAALLRAVNVGGTGKLAMDDLKKLATKCGFDDVATYIASGNLVFTSAASSTAVGAKLAAALAAHMKKDVAVLIRTHDELARALAENPFPKEDPARVMVFFLPDKAPPKSVLDDAKGRATERLALGTREIWVHYPDGQAKTKLKVPLGDVSTARNVNTLAKLVAMTAD